MFSLQPMLDKLSCMLIVSNYHILQRYNLVTCLTTLTVVFKLQSVYRCISGVIVRLANCPGMAGIIPELTHGIPCPGRGSFCPGNVKIDNRAWIYGCSLMSVLYFVLCLSVTHDLTWV